jgi:hypothetical protein
MSGKERDKARQVAERDDGWKCHYCHINLIPADADSAPYVRPMKQGGVTLSDPDNWTWPYLDHKHPQSKGGPSTLDNLVLACAPCNTRKGARRTYAEFYAMTAELRASRSES